MLDAILERWREGRVAAIERQAEVGDETRAEKCGGSHDVHERANTQGIAIELPIGSGRARDPTAVGAAGAVDAARLEAASAQYRELGLSAPEAEARAVMFYTFLFGQSMLFLDETPRKRANLVAACAKVLMEIQQQYNRHRRRLRAMTEL